MDELENQASSPSPAVSTSSAVAKPRVLACVLCQTRKIKCNRESPCQNCIRAGIRCVQSVPAPPRKRKRPHQDLINRVADLESGLHSALTVIRKTNLSGLLATTSNNFDPNALQQINALQQLAPAPGLAPAQNGETHGALVPESGGIRFMDSKVLATIYDELRNIQQMLNHDTDDEDDASDIFTPDENSDLVLGGDNMSPSATSMTLEDLWPDPAHVFRLWHLYVSRVNPLTKIIHVPSLQAFVAEGTTGCSTLPKNLMALFFSIFLMAVVTMSPDECDSILACSKQVALQRFSSGVRMCLRQVNFLVDHDFTILQALVIYLISLQGRCQRHAAWIQNGVAIRMAQKMGLHRDGQRLRLTPFDTEMRRRLWWQIIMLDAKYAMMTGLNESVLPRGWDTEEPKNINDADMHSGSTEYYQDRDGPTEMVFCLMTSKIAKFMVNTPNIEALVLCAEADGPPGGDPEEKARLRAQLAALGETLLGVLNKYCDPRHGAVHQLADEVRSQVLQKLTVLTTMPQEQPEYGTEIHGDQDNAFKLAVCGLEQEERNCTSSQANGFLWYALLHFQVEIVLFVAGQLSQRTEGTLVKRAWKQMGEVYRWHPELFDLTKKEHHLLARVVLRAWSKLERVSAEQGRPAPEQAFYIQKLQAMVPAEEFTTAPTPPQFARQLDYAIRPPNPQLQPDYAVRPPNPQPQPDYAVRPPNPQPQPGTGDMGFDPMADAMPMPSLSNFNAGPHANGFTSNDMSDSPHQPTNLDPGYGQYISGLDMGIAPLFHDVYGEDPSQHGAAYLNFGNSYGANGYSHFDGPS